MGTEYTSRTSVSFRLPQGVAETLDSLAEDLDMSKTDVVSEAIQAFARKRRDDLITEGMIEGADENRELARAYARHAGEVFDPW